MSRNACPIVCGGCRRSGAAFAPTGTTASFSATFSLKLFYKSAAALNAPLSTEQNTTFTTLTGSKTALSKTVEKQTRALRVLAVPGISAPLSATDAGTLSSAMAAVGRAYPVPDGVSNSLSGTGGIRYSINGGAHDDILLGGVGADVVFGGSGNDKLFGESGDDALNGSTGTDRVDGGTGSDLANSDGLDKLLGVETVV